MKKIISFFATTALILTSAVNSFAAGIGVGTHIDHKYPIKENLEKAVEAEVEWIRDGSSWSGVETVKGELQIREHNLNAFKEIKKEGINLLCNLAYGNTLYTPESKFVLPTQDNTEYYNAFLNYVEFVVKELRNYVDAWEVWNEPNGANFNFYGTGGAEYAKLYLDCAEIIRKYDPSAKVVCGVVMGYTGNNIKYGKEILSYLHSKVDVNECIDVFSIHKYTNDTEGEYVQALNTWEKVFDDYGYTGEVWMTENGASSHNNEENTQFPPLTENEQATYVARYAVQWERYLKENNRKGENFWYDLKNDGESPSNIEHNYGLVDYTYNNKPAFYAAKTYNRLTNNKELVAYTESEKGYLAEYTDGIDKVYIAFGETQNVPVSGDVINVYDYLGEVIETTDSSAGTISVNPTEAVVYVECINDTLKFTEVNYNQNKNVLIVSGTAVTQDNLEIAVEKDNTIIKTFSATVKEDGTFSKTFSVDNDGFYVITVKDGINEISKEIECKKNSPINNKKNITEAVVSFDTENKKGAVNAVVEDSVNDEIVSIAVVPADSDLTSLKISDFAYLGETKIENGLVSHNFRMKEDSKGLYKVLLGRACADISQTHLFITHLWDYACVADVEISDTDDIKVVANILNYNSSAKNVSVIIAQYSYDGRLLKLKETTEMISGDQIETKPYSLSDVKAQGMSYYKVFVWDSTGTMMPLCEVK